MAVSEEDTKLCIDFLTRRMLDYLQKIYPNRPIEELQQEFFSSHTYKILKDPKTGMCFEGPVYILSWYAREKGIKVDFL